MLRIARIVKSNSHVDYVGRVIDRLDASEPPAEGDYGFAQFVFIPLGDVGGRQEEIVGVVYDTQLVNPEYGSFGPRLSPREELAVLSPDYLNEQGVLVGILLLGWRARPSEGGRWASHHGVPRRVIPVGQEVCALPPEDVSDFHRGADGSVALRYFPQVVAHAGSFAVPVVEAVIDQLEPGCTREDRQRLCVLRRSLSWQRTLGQMRL
jgi:hypothetical protein